MTPEEILAKAADLIEERGWCQGVGITGTGQRCLGRALWDATGLPIDAQCPAVPAWRDAEAALTKELDPLDIILYNDAPGRTKEEVVTALRNAKRWL